MNQIRKIVQAKIDDVINLAEVAMGIQHNATIGELRESYLMDFFKELIPSSVSLTSGFITDAGGKISPQLDFIVTKKSALPLIEMKNGLAIVPIESVLLTAEIKSSLSTTDFFQIEKQITEITSLQITGDMGSNDFIVPTVILAYDHNIAEKTLLDWMNENGNIVACCTFKNNTYLKYENMKVFKNLDFDIKHYGVLEFVSTFHKILVHLNDERDFRPNLDVYLTGRAKTKD